MPTGTITNVTGSREWTGKYGTMVDDTFTIEVEGKEVEVYKTRKPDSPAPTPGETLDFEKVKQDQHGIKIKKVYDTPYQANGGGVPSQAARSESIERQVATKCAAQVIAAYVANGKTPPSAFVLTDEFHQAIRGYTVEVDPKANVAQESLPTPDTDGLDAKPDPDDDIPF